MLMGYRRRNDRDYLVTVRTSCFQTVSPVSPRFERPRRSLSVYQVIFKEAAARGTVSKYLSLFPGLGFGAGYKILQRVYKFGGQVAALLCFLASPRSASPLSIAASLGQLPSCRTALDPV